MEEFEGGFLRSVIIGLVLALASPLFSFGSAEARDWPFESLLSPLSTSPLKQSEILQ